MKSFKIDSKSPKIRITPTRKFYGENSLLSLKITSVPYEHINQPIALKVTYGNVIGNEWSVYVIFDPPYYFNAVTPDLRHMRSHLHSPEFSWIEIKANDNLEYKIEVSFNTNLHRDLDPFRKPMG